MQPLQSLPTEQSQAGDFARRLAVILGPSYTPADGTRIAADLLALGGALAGARDTNLAALNEAFVTSAVQLLSELETSYGLTPRPDISVEDRRVRLIAKIRAARAGTPQSILRAIHTYDPTAQLNEVTPNDISPRTSDGTYPGTDRGVFHITITLSDAIYANTSTRSEIAAIVEQMKPAHVSYTLATSYGFFADISLTDVGVLGV